MNEIDDLLMMVAKNGVVMVGEAGIEALGFEFNYDDDRFDGCRMGQLLPLLFLKQQVDKKLVEYMSAENRYGLETGFSSDVDALDLLDAYNRVKQG